MTFAAESRAGVVHSGVLTDQEDGGITAAGLWDSSQTGDNANNGFRLEYEVSENGSYYTYQYWFSGLGDRTSELTRGLSHAIIEVSDNFTASDALDGTTEFDAEELKTHNQSEGNPGLPSSIYGIKWETEDFTEDAKTFHLVINTYRVPMLGDFYAKDGGNPETYAFSNGEVDLYVPDTTVIPSPTAGLAGLAMFGGVVLRRRMI